MALPLDEQIDKALGRQGIKGGPQVFAGDPSAISKANQVLETIRRENFDASHAVFISIGGADGTELDHILRNTKARYGLLLEFNDDLSEKARDRARALQTDTGKQMEIFTGDAVQKVEPALRAIEKWYHDGHIRTMVLTMHAVLHELPNRGSGTADIEAFLQNFLWRGLPILAIAREPCMPEGLPSYVYLSAHCSPDRLAKLANRIRTGHSEFFAEKALPMANSVRLDSRLAIETIVKLFYLEALSYEIEERSTSFTKQDLVGAFRNVFGTDRVRTESFQTDSFDRLWSEMGVKLQNEQLTELPKPEIHVRIVAKWTPAASGPPGVGFVQPVPQPIATAVWQELHTELTNPYDPWTPALPPRFVGRKAVLRRLETALKESRSVSLVGDRRIGKSSLMLTWAEQARVAGHTVKFVGGDGPEGASVKAFVQTVTGLSSPDESDSAANVLSGWIDKAGLPGLLPLILVDEADGIVKRFDVRFFERLRGMLSRMCLVLASRLEIDRIYRELGLTSPFENRLELHWIGLLEPEAADELVGRGKTVLKSSDIALLYEWAGHHPFYLQLLGRHLFDAQRLGEPTQLALDRFRAEAAARLRVLWHTLSHSERAELWRVIDGYPMKRWLLRVRGLATDEGKLFGRVLEEWLRDEGDV